MKQRWWLNAILALVVVALGAWLYFSPTEKNTEKTDEQFKLFDLQPKQVTLISIERPGQPEIRLEKQGDKWFVTSPFKGRANAIRIDSLLTVLDASSSERFAADNLARFELDKPFIKLTINDQTLSFGTQHPLTNQVYGMINHGVYLISPRYFSLAAAPAHEFASNSLFADDESPIGFSFPFLSLNQQEGKWIADPSKGTTDQDKLNAWADEWRHAMSLTTQPYGGDKAIESFSVTLANGKTILFKLLQTEPEFVLLREDENLQYHFSRQIGQKLINPPGFTLP